MNRDKKDVVRTLATIFFRDYGIKNVSMDDIAANCGISKRTLYGLFKNKKEIVSTIVQSEMERMTLDLSEINKTASNEVMVDKPGKLTHLRRMKLTMANGLPRFDLSLG